MGNSCDNPEAVFLLNAGINMLGCIWICFHNKIKGFMQHVKGIRCLQIVSKPGFLEKDSEQLFKKAQHLP